MHNPDLSGKVAAITGASSGIGEATALALAGSGAAVALAARRADRIEELAKRIESEGGRAVAIPTDVSKQDDAKVFVEQAKEQLGRLDVLVNNAGLMLLGPVYGADTNEWERMVHINMLGLLYCTHAALPIMGEQGSGHIVNVSSVAGRSATLGAAVYNLTKFGVNGFSEALRQEMAGANVRVTVIEPGYVATELQGHNTHPMVVDALEKAQEEIGDVLQAGDIADAILYAVGVPQHVSVNEVLVRPDRAATLKQAVGKKEEQSLQTRERLLEAAAGLFARNGFRNTSVQQIGEAAGISRGSIFWHFGSKEGLLWAVAEREFARWQDEVLVPAVGEAGGIAAVRAALEAHRRFLTEQTDALRLFLMLMFEALGPRPEMAADFARLHQRLKKLGGEWIERGVERGEVRADVDAEAVAVTVIGALGGIAYQYLLDPRGVDLDAVYPELAASLERGLRA